MPQKLELDHITVIARSLAEGVAHVENRLGVTVPPGGKHPMMGTHNALMRIGIGVFLEIIAVDPEAEPPLRPRWFGLDDWTDGPRLAVYVLRTQSIEQSLASDGLEIAGEAVDAKRGDLTWQISVAPDGRPAFDGAFPSLIEWHTEEFPADGMMDLQCRLSTFEIQHPDAKSVAARLDPVLEDARVQFVMGPTTRLTARFDTPSGERWLD